MKYLAEFMHLMGKTWSAHITLGQDLDSKRLIVNVCLV